MENPEQIFDLHCHPSLKYLIWGKDKFYEGPHATSKGEIAKLIPLSIYYDFPGVKQSAVKVLVNAHYVPENGFRHSIPLQVLGDSLIEEADKPGRGRTVKPNASAWEKLQVSIRRLEELVRETNEVKGAKSVY